VRSHWRPWLRVAAVAAALLVLSEALWFWQTWPVRELLQPADRGASTP
jgi:HAMP domain-containing protein